MSEIESTPKRRSWIKQALGWGIAMIIIVPTLVLAITPSHYLIERPGPVYNVLGSSSGQPILEISGKPTYKTEGELDLLTITFSGGPERGASWLDVWLSYLSPDLSLVEKDLVYPPDVDGSQVQEEAELMMLDSQANAKAAALNLLGIPFTTEVKITSVIKSGPAFGLLKAGDTLLTVDGEVATGIDQVRSMVEASKGARPVVFLIERNGVEKTIEVTAKQKDDTWRVGIYVQNVPEFPFTIDINLDNVSGPSGGQIFALAIYDELTPGSLTGGNQVAGTGTVTAEGVIGPIGGIKQKMYAAVGAGAKYFLAPSENCSEVVGNIPDGLQVIRVSKLQDSLDALAAIKAGKSSNLPICKKK